MEAWIMEHNDACRKGELERSVIAENAWNHHHLIKGGKRPQLLIEQANGGKCLLKRHCTSHLHLRGGGEGATLKILG